jgi:hypothetical protein
MSPFKRVVYYRRYLTLLIICTLIGSATLNYSSIDFNTFTIVPDGQSLHEPMQSQPFISMSLEQVVKQIKRKQLPAYTKLVIPSPPSNQLVDLYTGIKAVKSDRIIIVSAGRNPFVEHSRLIRLFKTPREAAGVRKMRQYMQNNIFQNATFVTFDYVYKKKVRYDFGYQSDLERLSQVVSTVVAKNPHAHITLVGDCRGAYSVLLYLGTHPHNEMIDTVVLESPFAQIDELISTISTVYLKPFFGTYSEPLLHGIFKWAYPAYNRREYDHVANLLTIVKDKKIFIGHHTSDRIISGKQIDTIVQTLCAHNKVHLVVSSDKAGWHSHMAPITDYQHIMNAFCLSYDLPHKTMLAQRGIEALNASLVTPSLNS